MARDFWLKTLTHQHFADEIESAPFRSSHPKSALVLETSFWRRIDGGTVTCGPPSSAADLGSPHWTTSATG